MKITNRIAEYWPSARRPGEGERQRSAWPDLDALARSAERFILEHPGPSLAAAFTLGVFVAWFIKRR